MPALRSFSGAEVHPSLLAGRRTQLCHSDEADDAGASGDYTTGGLRVGRRSGVEQLARDVGVNDDVRRSPSFNHASASAA